MGEENFVLSSLVTPKESHLKAGWVAQWSGDQ